MLKKFPNTYDEGIKSVLKDPNIDWFGMEMIPHTFQSVVDDFMSEDVSLYQSAEKVIRDYFKVNWNNKFENNVPTESGNQYFDLLYLAKDNNKKVYCMDVAGHYYVNRPQSGSLALPTRNHVWAHSVPNSGRGVMFGGAAHFSWSPTVQEFLQDRFPRREIVSVCSLDEEALIGRPELEATKILFG